MPLLPRKLAHDDRLTPGALAGVLNDLIDSVGQLQTARTAAPEFDERVFRAASPLAIRRGPAGFLLQTQTAELEELVELLEDLHIGGSAAAKVLAHDGTAWVDAPTATLEVHDAIGTFEGLAGARALVRFHRRSGRWLVWQLRC